ncbi:MAG: hypothetical protein Q4D38_05925 [Planctomycetia bacterium]|nr:hypothetical protein [Planctomycetia bacterium]
MNKSLCLVGMVLSILILLVFVIDISVGIPFGRHSIVLDVVFILLCLGTAWQGWTTYRAQ